MDQQHGHHLGACSNVECQVQTSWSKICISVRSPDDLQAQKSSRSSGPEYEVGSAVRMQDNYTFFFSTLHKITLLNFHNSMKSVLLVFLFDR